jgi:nucleotide-binding universal stress UspA family protein
MEELMDLPLIGATLLVGIDFSDCCERALRQAVTFAERDQAQLELVHVVEWEGHPAFPEGNNFFSLGSHDSPLWRAMARQAQAFLQRLGQFCSYAVEDRVPAQIRVLIGDPAECLLQAAARASAAAIVLGAQGRCALPQRAVGRTAEQVCAKSTLPVLLAASPERSPIRRNSGLFLAAGAGLGLGEPIATRAFA